MTQVKNKDAISGKILAICLGITIVALYIIEDQIRANIPIRIFIAVGGVLAAILVSYYLSKRRTQVEMK